MSSLGMERMYSWKLLALLNLYSVIFFCFMHINYIRMKKVIAFQLCYTILDKNFKDGVRTFLEGTISNLLIY